MEKIKFNIFKLHDSRFDISPKSWICFKGKNLKKIFDNLVNDVIKQKEISKRKLNNLISKKLNCSFGPLEERFYCRVEWFPIPIINILLSFIKNKQNYKEKITNATEFLKCNNATAKQVKAIKSLTIPLCKISGAHAADGNLHVKLGIEIKDKQIKNKLINILKKENCKFHIFETGNHLRIKLRIEYLKILNQLKYFRKEKKIIFWVSHGLNIAEMYKSPLQAYQKWVFQSFGIKSKIKKYSTKNAYRIDLDNKIVARYLNKFLDFPLGKKTYTVKEPRVIKNSSIKFRKAFLSAFMTFEGHVPRRTRRIEVSSRSKVLVNSIHEILTNLQIPMKNIKIDNYNRWLCISQPLKEKSLKRALLVFEENTEKWNRLKSKMKNEL